MNIKTFNTKEFLYYSIPVMLVDLALHLGIYEWLLTVFPFTQEEDLILTQPRSLYFLLLGFVIAMIALPVKPYERGYQWKRQVMRVFYQCLITIGVLAVSINVLFYSFAGFFYLYEGLLSVTLISLWHTVFRYAILYARKKGRNKVHVVIVGETRTRPGSQPPCRTRTSLPTTNSSLPSDRIWRRFKTIWKTTRSTRSTAASTLP